MRKAIKKIIFLCLMMMSFVISSSAVQDGLVAVINDEIITLNDLKSYVYSNYFSLTAQGVPNNQIEVYMSQLKDKVLERLIEDRLILSKANELELNIRKEAVDERLKEYQKRYESEDVFMQLLVENGGTLTEMRNKLKDQIKIQYVIDYEVRSKIYVNPHEVTDYYNDHKDEFGKKESVTLDSIFIPRDEYGDQGRIISGKVLKKIKENQNFSNIARQYSKMPSVGVVKRGQMMENIEKIVFNLKINEVSSIVETTPGFYIFKLVSRQKKEVPLLENIKPFIQKRIFDMKFQKEFTRWLEGLKEQAYIEIK